MKKLLSNLPLGVRPALLLLSMILGLAATFQMAYQPARANLEQVSEEEDRISRQLADLRDRRDTLRAGGADGIDQLFSQVQAVDDFLPAQPDRSTLIRELPQTAGQVGAQMASLSPADPPEDSVLDAYAFRTTVTGSAAQVEAWLTSIQSGGRFITVSDVSYARNERQGQVTFTVEARLDVWFSDSPPLTEDPDAALDAIDDVEPDDDTPGDAEDDSGGGTSDDPGLDDPLDLG